MRDISSTHMMVGGLALIGLLFSGCRSSGGNPSGEDESRTASAASEEPASTGGEELPTCGSYEEARRLSGERVSVVGNYEQVDVRKTRPGEEREPEYRGHVVVRTESGDGIYLEPTWSEEAIRPSDEIERLEGRRVRAVGTIHGRCPPPDTEARVAMITSPCLKPVETVEKVD